MLEMRKGSEFDTISENSGCFPASEAARVPQQSAKLLKSLPQIDQVKKKTKKNSVPASLMSLCEALR